MMFFTPLTITLALFAAVAQATCTSYTCPDATCATSLAACDCTANAVVGLPDATFDRDSTNWVVTQTLTAAASATYGVPSGNCSTYAFAQFATYSWSLSNSTTTVFNMSGSSLSIPSSTMTPNVTYMLTLTAKGLLSTTQVSAQAYTINAIASTPRVSITSGGGSERRYSTLHITTLTAVISDDFPIASPVYGWTCVPEGTCPSIADATATSLVIAAGAPVSRLRLRTATFPAPSRLRLSPPPSRQWQSCRQAFQL